MSAAISSYRAPFWLPGGHLQTLWPWFFSARPQLPWQRERLELPDGDFLDIDWLGGPAERPLVIAFHGLEGSARGHYMLALAQAVSRAGGRFAAVNFRGCSGEPNRLARAYFAGDSTEIGQVIRRLKPRAQGPVHAVGYSLGGNALLLWLAEQQDSAREWLSRAVAVSAPLDLPAAGRTLDRGAARLIYTGHFLRSLKRKARELAQRHPGHFDLARVEQARTLHDFDQHFTAPLHGYASAEAYWQTAASLPGLRRIAVDTLLINARNDPFLPAETLPDASRISPAITCEFPEQGGHAGFPGSEWLLRRILTHLDLDQP